jgi:ABC-type branched-subunit amino acid transport system substrate-binding protein
MQTTESRLRALGLVALTAATACNAVLGLGDYSVAAKNPAANAGGTAARGAGGNGAQAGPPDGGGATADTGGSGSGGESERLPEGGAPDGSTIRHFDAAAPPECTTNRECTDRETAAAAGKGADGGVVAAVCVKPEGHCVKLLSEDCNAITGDYLDDHAIFLGSLFSTKGAQAATNLPRQNSATLAVEEINLAGGIPGATSADSRPLVMVSCDESTLPLRAAGHLITDLHVPAIVGPNTSQDTLDISTKLSVRSGTVLISPTAVASSIPDLLDDGLTWLMVPSDVQRAPLMVSQLNALETRLKDERSKTTIKLGVVYRDDALGVGTRTSLNSLVLNGKALSDPVNLGTNVQITPYDFTQADQAGIVSAYVTFAPDIIVLAGTAEAVTKVMVPLEQAWTATDRPEYVLIDSAKVPDVITATKGNDDLRRRIRGTGITPGPQSSPVYGAFKVDYLLRYPGTSATISGMGPSYDATYAIAYALAATKALPASGKNIAAGLRKLSGGPTTLEMQGTKILAAFQKLAAGQSITAIGTFGPAEWDTNGAVIGGTLEMWCIGATTPTPAFQSSGLTFDVKTQQYAGTYTQCAP